MEDLVIMHNEQAVTTSLVLAEVFEKKHQHVLRDIDALKDVSNFGQMFFESNEPDSYGRNRRIYFMNRDGFTLIAMGYTGSKAMEFKLKYIEAFNKMEQVVRQELPQTPEEKLELTMMVASRLDKRVGKLEKSIDEIQNKSEIDSSQRYKLRHARNKKAVGVLNGKDSNAYKDKSLSRKTFRALEREFKEAFVISRYEDLRKENFDKAIKFINNWYPPFALKQEIEARNAQENLL